MGLARQHWEYIKALRPSPGRLVHVSKELPHWRTDTVGKKTVRTWIADPVGETFFDYRNARKAAYREDARRERRLEAEDAWIDSFLDRLFAGETA